jgi:hypothetical protein
MDEVQGSGFRVQGLITFNNLAIGFASDKGSNRSAFLEVLYWPSLNQFISDSNPEPLNLEPLNGYQYTKLPVIRKE